MSKFIIASDSCCDLSTYIRKEYDIEYYRMGVILNGTTTKTATLDFDEYSFKQLYDWMREGNKMKTNQVVSEEYLEKSRKWLKDGYDILYIACSSGLSGSINTFLTVVKPILEKEFPERKIIGIDPLTTSTGEGLMCIHASKMRKEGKSMEEIAETLLKNKYKYNVYATVATLTYLKNAGRVKAAKAFLGNLFHKRPIIVSDKNGNNSVLKTVTGTKNSITEIINGTKEVLASGECDMVLVGHGDDLATAELVKERILKETNAKEVLITEIGPICGISCGPGVIIIGSYGNESKI